MMCVISISIALFEIKDDFPYTIYDLGFTYRYRVKGTDKKDNFLEYAKIISIKFISNGLKTELKTKMGHEIMIDADTDYRAYVILLKVLIKHGNISKSPNLKAITQYYQKKNGNNDGSGEKLIADNDNLGYNNILEINNEFN